MVYPGRRIGPRKAIRDDPPQYLGPVTQEVAKQMVFSILNTKPAFRNKVWGESWQESLFAWVKLA